MKLLITISSLQIGGEQRALCVLTNQFVKMGVDVTIYSLSKKPEKMFDFNAKVKIVYRESNSKFLKNLKRTMDIRKMIINEKYDIILGFAMIPSVLCSFAAWKVCPCIVTERNDPKVYPLFMKIARYFSYHLATAGIFQTNDAANYFPYLEKKIVIPNPINSDIIPDRDARNISNRIVNISRLVPEKNQKILIEAFAEIHDKFPDYRLAFYGDGSEKNNLSLIAEQLNVKELVDFYPATNDILSIIANDAVFVLTSNHEGFPNALAEALAIGIPCISTNCRIGGPKDMIIHNVNGKLFPVGNCTRLVNELDSLLSSEELRTSFSNESVKLRVNLNDKNIAKRWVGFISNIISDNRRSVNEE